MGVETAPAAPPEGEPGTKGTFSKRKFKTAGGRSTGKQDPFQGFGGKIPQTPKLNMDNIDLDLDAGADDGTDVTLKKLQAQEIETTQKQLATLRKVHDKHHREAEQKVMTLKILEQELNAVRMLQASTEHEKGQDMKHAHGINNTQNKLDSIQLKLEEELQNKEIFTHMIKRLTDELVESKTNVRETNDQLLLADQDFQSYQVQLHQTRQGQRTLEMKYAELKKKAATRRQKQEKKIVEIRKAIEQRVQQRVRQEQMETKREAIAARAKGDLGTEEEERLKRMFVVRSLYSSMLEQKVQKEALFLEKMEQGFQKIKTATGISDVQEIIQKFKTKDETHQTLMLQEGDTKARITDLQKEQVELQAALEEVTTSLMAAGGNREMYQEVDNVDEALNAARKQMNDFKTRATKLDLILEESRMSVRKFLSKLDARAQELPTLDELPDAIDKVDSKVSSLLKKVIAQLEEMSGGDEDKVQEGELKPHGAAAGDESAKGSTPFGHSNAGKVNDMLFHRLMNVEPNTSEENVRIPLRPSLRQEESEAKQNSPRVEYDEEVSVYAGGRLETFRITKAQAIDEEDEEEDGPYTRPDAVIDRPTAKQLANMIAARERANLKKTEKPGV